jgi:hypothetical protein
LGWELLGGKFALLARMLDKLYKETDDRIVIVSNYTQVSRRDLLCCVSAGSHAGQTVQGDRRPHRHRLQLHTGVVS